MLTSALAGPMQMDFIVRLRWIRLRHTFGSIGQSPDDRFSPRRCLQVNRWDFICITCARINSLKIYVNCSHVRLIFKPHLHLHPAIDRSPISIYPIRIAAFFPVFIIYSDSSTSSHLPTALAYKFVGRKVHVIRDIHLRPVANYENAYYPRFK